MHEDAKSCRFESSLRDAEPLAAVWCSSTMAKMRASPDEEMRVKWVWIKGVLLTITHIVIVLSIPTTQVLLGKSPLAPKRLPSHKECGEGLTEPGAMSVTGHA